MLRNKAIGVFLGAIMAVTAFGGAVAVQMNATPTTATAVTVGGKNVTKGRWKSVITDKQTRKVRAAYKSKDGKNISYAYATQTRTRTRTQKYNNGKKVGGQVTSGWSSWTPKEGNWKCGGQKVSILKSKYGYKSYGKPSYGATSTTKSVRQTFVKW